MEDIKYIVDTNVLLNNPEIINEINCVITIPVLRELEKHKRNCELIYKVREATRVLEESKIYFDGTEVNDSYVDDSLIKIAKNNNYGIVTEDLLLKIRAKTYNIPTYELNEKHRELYKGFKLVKGNTEYINNFYEQVEAGELKPYINQYFTIHNTDLCKEKDAVKEVRFDGKNFVSLKLPDSKVLKGLNPQQRFALDLLNNSDIPIKIIVGTFGSGKSYLTTKLALHKVMNEEEYASILFLRNPIVSGEEIGFLPGDKQSKIIDFCQPFLQYVESPKMQNYAERLIADEKIRMDVISYIKGLNIEDTFIIMDEAEDLNLKLIKLVGSRVGKKSCVVFTGDWKQAEMKYQRDNGLLKLIDKTKGDPHVGIVVLEEDLRSSASKVFADLE